MTNDCEFLVDALPTSSHDTDTFPTRLIAEAAERIVEKCMVEGIDGAETIGASAVGPKRVIVVILKKRGWNVQLNGTDVTLLKPGNFSGSIPSLIEDG